EVLTGFKYIGEQIRLFEEDDREYVFGLEESYGCLAGTYARDKDAVVAVMLLCEVAAFYKKQGMTLWDAMVAMYERYGYYKEGLTSIEKKGISGKEEIAAIMDKLRSQIPEQLGDYQVLAHRDYQKGIRYDRIKQEESRVELPESNVLYYELSENAWVCVRPSGTEPKIKFYYGVKGSSLVDADAKLEELKDALLALANM
ncbi:MAG: phospho-sugar mutase, partial [Lachnospiraceae bacterium]|nr:phospho-sugar mutase [Lachnospiraceae bacterium]